MKPTDLNLSITPKLSKLGRPYRHYGAFDLEQESKWINKMESRPFIYMFIYTDDNSLFAFEYSYGMEFKSKWVHEKCRNFLNNIKF
jgi:hypothetical protein